MRCDAFYFLKESCPSEELFEDWCEEGVEDGFGPCGEAGEDQPYLRRQMAAGKKESVSLSLLMEVNNSEVEEALSTMTTLFLSGMRVDGQMQKAWRKWIFEVQTWKQVRGPAGAVMWETRDLGIE